MNSPAETILPRGLRRWVLVLVFAGTGLVPMLAGADEPVYEPVEIASDANIPPPKLLAPMVLFEPEPLGGDAPKPKEAAPPAAKGAAAATEKPAAKAAPAKDASPPAKTTPAEPKARAERKIVFNFVNAPWDQVLTRFAELSGLSLLMEVRPPGTFSFSDSKAHTVEEALDILNGVLLAKDFLLLRNDRFLTLVPLDKPLPSDLVPRVSPEDLPKRGRNEMVSVILTLDHTDPNLYQEELKGILSKHGTIVPVGKLKLLRVTDLAGKLREAVPLIERIDEASKPKPPPPPSPPAPKVEKIVTLKHMDAKQASAVLGPVFGESAKVAVGHDRSKLIVVATEADQQRIGSFLEKVDVPPAAPHQSTQKAYPLDKARVKTLAESMLALFPEATTGAKISGDEQNNALLVDATPEIHEKIEALLKDLDRPQPYENLVERIYRPKHADVNKLLETLQSLYSSPITRVALDSTGAAIVVRTNADRHAKIARLVEELDEGPEDKSGMVEKVVRLKHANPETMASTLEKLYPRAATRITFTGDAANGVLVVRGPKETLDRIVALVEQIDLPTGLGKSKESVYRPKAQKPADLVKMLQSLYPTSTNVQAFLAPDGKGIVLSIPTPLEEKVRATLEAIDVAREDGEAQVDELYRLKYAQATELAETLRKLYPEDQSAVRISADSANKVLVVSAPPAVQQKIKELIERVDVPSETRLEERLYTPADGRAGEAITTIRSLYGTDGKSTFTLAPNGRTIIALAPLRTHEKIEALLSKMEDAPDPRSEKILRPRHVQPGPLVNTLQNLYSSHPDVRITVDASGKGVVVMAPAAMQEKIAAIVAELDKPDGEDEAGSRKVYPLTHASSYYIASTLQSLFPPSETKGRITYENNTNSVVVVGPDAFQDKIKKLIEEFDVDPKRNVVEKIYPLQHLPAQQAVDWLQRALASQSNTTVTLAPGGGKIVVLAPAAVHERVDRLLKTFDQPSLGAGGDERKLYKLEHGASYYVASALQTLFPQAETGARITYDSTTNVVIVVAPAKVQKKIEEVIAEVDVEPRKGIVEEAYTTTHIPVAQAAEMVRQALAAQTGVTVAAVPGAARFLVAGPRSAQDRVRQLLERIDQPEKEGAGGARKIYKLAHASSPYVSSSLQTLFPQTETGAKITYDPQNNAVLVVAPDALQEKIAKVVADIDQPAGDRVEKVYRLDHARAERLVDSLRTLLASSPAARAIAGPDDKSLVVSASPVDQGRVAEYLKQFDRPDAVAEPVQKLYRLRHSRAANLAQSLRTLLNNERDTTVSHDEANNALVVLARPAVQDRVRQWIDEFDQPGTEKAMVEQVYHIQHGSAEAVLRSLREVYSNPDLAKFSADSRNQVVLARVAAELAPRVAETIKMLDQPKRRLDRDVEVVPLVKIDPFSAEDALRSLFRDESSDDRPSIEAIYDPPQLVLRATPEQMTTMRTMLRKMGEDVAVGGAGGEGAPRGDTRTVRTLRVPKGDPRTIAESIEKLWPRLRRNPIMVVAGARRVGDIVPAAPKEDAKKAEPAVKTEGKEPKLPGDPAVPVILTPGVNRLVASSTDPEALRLVEELVDSLTETPDFDQGEFTIFYLQTANAADVAKTIDEAFNGRQRSDSSREGGGRSSRGPDRVRAVPDVTSNAIVVRASPVDLVNIQRLIDSLDTSKAAEAAAKQPRIIPLRHAQADDVMVVLRGIYADYLQAGTGGPLHLPGFAARTDNQGRTTAVSIGVDARSNSLVVAAPETVFEQIQTLAQSLDDAARASGRSYRVLPLKNSSPLEVRDALEILLDRESRTGTSSSGSRSGSGSRPRRAPTRPRSPRSSPSARPTSGAPTPLPGDVAGGATVIPDAHRSTMVTTIHRGSDGVRVTSRKAVAEIRAEQVGGISLAGHQEPEAPAEKADTPPEPQGVAEQAAPPLPPGLAAPPVEGAGQAGPVGGNVDVRALPELGVLLLLGNETDLKLLSEIVAQIEKIAADRQLVFEIHPLQNAKASELADLLNDLYQRTIESRASQTLAQSRAEILPLARPNALLLAAPKDEIDFLRKLASRFDVAVPPDSQFRIFRLKYAKAVDLTQVIENFYRNRAGDGELSVEILVEPDRRSNSLLAYGGPNDLAELAALVKELDVDSTGAVNELKVFALRHTVATELALTLEGAIQGRTIGPGPSPAASRSEAGMSLELLTPDPKSRSAINSGILENVRITPNRRANTLIVSAPPKTMNLLEALIRQLDVLPQALAEIKVFTLVNSDAATMARTLRSLFLQLQSQAGQVALTPTPGIDGASPPLVELTFSIDERTNSVLVSGSKEQLQVVEAIILRLDGSDIEERKTMVYKLKNADAVAVSNALTQLLQRQNELQQLQEGVSLQQQIEREIVVVPEDVSNSLLISSTPRFYQRLIELIEKLDELPPQVVIQVLVVQVDLQKTKEIGGEIGLQDSILFDRSIFPGSGIFTNNGFPFLTPQPTNAVLNTAGPVGVPGFNFNTAGPLGNNTLIGPATIGNQGLSSFGVGRTSARTSGASGFVFSASSESVNILLRALATCRRLEVLSRPQIMTLDNQQAFIQVGQQIPLVTASNIFGVGTVQNSIEYRDVGIILEVVPKINPDGSVVMRVDPQISALASQAEVATPLQLSPGVNAAVINITQASTTVSAENGQTAVIGGLIRKETETEVRKVPFLGDIPLVKFFFRYDQSRVLKREVLIFLTPHVVRSYIDAERIKVLEAERIDFCVEDAEKVHGPLGLPTKVELGKVVGDEKFYGIETDLVEVGKPPKKKKNKLLAFPSFPRKRAGESGTETANDDLGDAAAPAGLKIEPVIESESTPIGPWDAEPKSGEAPAEAPTAPPREDAADLGPRLGRRRSPRRRSPIVRVAGGP